MVLALDSRPTLRAWEDDPVPVICSSGPASRWVAGRFVPLVGATALSIDLLLGLILLTAPDAEFSSAVYRQARLVAPLQTWGVLLLCCTAFAALTWWVQGRCKLGGFLLAYVLGGFWAFWAVLTLASCFGANGASGFVTGLSVGQGAVHVLAGLAWPCRRPRPLCYPPPG